MKEYLQAKRNSFIYQIWEENKANLTMEELAEIFVISLNKAYRIIKNVALELGK